MSLQNKKLQLLSQDDTDNPAADVDDIFAQYGSNDTEDSSLQSATVSHDNLVVDVSDPIENVVANMNEGVVVEMPDPKNEKKWEQELEQQETITTVPVSKENIDALPAEVPEKELPEIVEKKSPVAPPVKENQNTVVQQVQPQKQTKASHVQRPNTPSREVHIDPGKKTIVIVDDDIDTLDMYADVFENADYNVIRATDGLDALNVISDHTPHLIFTGIVMPRMDGFAMMESLKQNSRTADIPVVINSHLGRESDRKRAEELGAKDFIVRGFTPPREALERIGALLMRNEYTFRFDHNDPAARKLAKDLGAGNFFVCPRGQEMVIKMSVIDPKDLSFSARFSCIDEKKDK